MRKKIDFYEYFKDKSSRHFVKSVKDIFDRSNFNNARKINYVRHFPVSSLPSGQSRLPSHTLLYGKQVPTEHLNSSHSLDSMKFLLLPSQFFSSELSPQSLALSHTQSSGMHLLLSQANSFSKQYVQFCSSSDCGQSFLPSHLKEKKKINTEHF